MDLRTIAAAAGIALVDIVLSGDNALVIGAAAGKLPRSQRLLAVVWGGVGAVVMRLALAIAATELLQVPLLRAIGGVVLMGISVRLLQPEREAGSKREPSDHLLPAVLTILAADATMSLDNVLAVGALAAGNVPLLVSGLAVSMLLLFVASTVIARLMDYFTWLLDVAAVVLAWTAATLSLEDPVVARWLHLAPRPALALHFGFVALILLVDLFLRAFQARVLAGSRSSTTRAAGASGDPTSVAGSSDVPQAQRDAATPHQ